MPLNDGLPRRLALIAALAGFGKSTLLSEWSVICEAPFAWVSPDQSDNDAARLLA
jgi:LuxR family maltose regulon positive regulatory protein